MDANSISLIETLFSKLPSIIFLKIKGHWIQLNHGALAPYISEEEAYPAMQNKEIGSYILSKETKYGLEWNDYAIHDKYKREYEGFTNETSRGGKNIYNITPEYAHKYAVNLGLTAIIGGHQDRTEGVAIVSRESPPGFIPSPDYKKYEGKTALHVMKDVCNLKSTSCTLLTQPIRKKISIDKANPQIIKTSNAYSSKQSVNCSSIITVGQSFEQNSGEQDEVKILLQYLDVKKPLEPMSVYCYMFPINQKRGKCTNDNWTFENLMKWTTSNWINNINSLKYYKNDHANQAYSFSCTRRINYECLYQLCQEFHKIYKENKSLQIIESIDDMCVFTGDIHSNIHAIADILSHLSENGYIDETMKMQKMFCFLGDYVDRGPYGLIVIACIIVLAIKAPDKILIIKGNHENKSIWKSGGFIKELNAIQPT